MGLIFIIYKIPVIFRVLPRGCLHCRLSKQMEQKILVVPVKAEKKIMGAFHSTLTSSLNFRQKWMEQCFQRFRKQRTTSRGIPKFSKNFFPGRFLSIHFALGISRIFGWMVRIQFPEFLETFPGNSCTIYPSFQVFESFGWMESAQYLEGITFYRKNGKHYTGMNRSICFTPRITGSLWIQPFLLAPRR